ncbi:unnamed protein product [Mycena citricolor]|uniref:HNH nuclease domain-containing protein n=1 Tax=Mycena citricolor TaxID=2018698 RepID=A0AAD2HY41_9AGAR|nr:unnamed protein product [Mycena citricolor]
MSSLPSLADVQFDHDGRTLWPNILSAEQAALEAAPTKSSAKYNNSLIGIRFLGFLLQDLWQHNQHSFGLTPYQRLIKEIASCLSISGQIPASEEEAEAQHGQLQNLGLFYRNHLIRIFRSNGDPIPQSSDPPSRPSMDVLRDRITRKMKTPTTPRSARQSALMRDGYRCMVTGQYDIHSADVYPELNDRAVADGEDTYNIVSIKGKPLKMGLPLPSCVTFRIDPDVVASCKRNQTNPPALPSPSLLAIRAACSRVAHLSGAAEQVDQILRDLEDRPVMAEDGGSAHLLESRLLQLSRAVSIEA